MDYFERKPKKIAVLRALQIGDLLTSVPALRALRYANPNAQIILIGLPWARDFVKRFSLYLDEWIEFPGYPGFPEREPNLAAMPDFFTALQQRQLDLAIQMHGSGTISNAIVAGFQAKISAGFHPSSVIDPAPGLYLPYPEDLPEPLRLLRLMEHLGFPPQDTFLEFPILQDDWKNFERSLRETRLEPGRYVIIHPGARAADRRWPIERFAYVADRLAAQGRSIVLTGSPDEASLVAEVESRLQFKAVNMAGRTSLGVAAAWVSQAALLICNDTGVSHIAAALNVPSIVLFSNSDPLRWAPLNRLLHQVVEKASTVPAAVIVDKAQDLLMKRPTHHSASRQAMQPVFNAQV